MEHAHPIDPMAAQIEGMHGRIRKLTIGLFVLSLLWLLGLVGVLQWIVPFRRYGIVTDDQGKPRITQTAKDLSTAMAHLDRAGIPRINQGISSGGSPCFFLDSSEGKARLALLLGDEEQPHVRWNREDYGEAMRAYVNADGRPEIHLFSPPDLGEGYISLGFLETGEPYIKLSGGDGSNLLLKPSRPVDE
ncbi:MAG: hypothetical protein U0800_02770 [Isosphaeraceae bacterium]